MWAPTLPIRLAEALQRAAYGNFLRATPLLEYGYHLYLAPNHGYTHPSPCHQPSQYLIFRPTLYHRRTNPQNFVGFDTTK